MGSDRFHFCKRFSKQEEWSVIHAMHGKIFLGEKMEVNLVKVGSSSFGKTTNMEVAGFLRWS